MFGVRRPKMKIISKLSNQIARILDKVQKVNVPVKTWDDIIHEKISGDHGSYRVVCVQVFLKRCIYKKINTKLQRTQNGNGTSPARSRVQTTTKTDHFSVICVEIYIRKFLLFVWRHCVLSKSEYHEHRRIIVLFRWGKLQTVIQIGNSWLHTTTAIVNCSDGVVEESFFNPW